MRFELRGKTVFAATGGKAFDSKLPVIVFLHGSALDHTFWSLYSRFFAFRGYAVLALDLPGHGGSDGPGLTTIEAMADWLDEVVEFLGIERLSLVGHSQGCLVALEYAARYAKRLRSISFISSGLATPVNASLLKAAKETPQAAVDMMNSWGFGDAGHFHRGPVPGSSLSGIGRKVMWRNAPDELATDLNACNNYSNGRIAAKKIRVPCQVMLAAEDRMAPRKAGMELAQHLQDHELHVVANSGHMLPVEVPDECRKLLRDFIFRNNPAA